MNVAGLKNFDSHRTALIPMPQHAYVLAGISTEQDYWHNKFNQVSYDLSPVMKAKLDQLISRDRWKVEHVNTRIALVIKSHAVARLVCSTMLHWPASVVLADSDRLTPSDLADVRESIENMSIGDYAETRYRGALTYAYWFESLKDAQRVGDALKLRLHPNRFSKSLIGFE